MESAARRALAGHFSLLLVVGDSGIGKTRLVEKLADRLDVATGMNRCSDLESQLPYAALSLALRPVLAPSSTDTVRPLSDVLRRYADSQPFDDLARLQTMETLASELSSVGPFVLVLDDVQWADEATITALGYLRRRSPQLPVAVVLSCSRDALRREGLRRLEVDLRVDLGVLTEADMEPLDDPDVAAWTGGHPLFVAAWHDARQAGLHDNFLPSVRGRVVTRIWDLGPQAYRLLTVAAVVDEPVQPTLLAALVDTAADVITDELDRLVDHGLLTCDADGFRFRHSPERQILSETMSPVKRKMLRQRAQAFDVSAADLP